MPGVFSLSRSCIPCLGGFHEACRHKADRSGAMAYSTGRSQDDPERPCACEEGQHVEDGTCGDMRFRDFYYVRCGKPVKGTIDQRDFGVKADVGRCGIHLSGIRRMRENDAKRKAEWDARNQRYEDEAAATKASRDWAERITREFGLPVEAMHSKAGAPRVSMHPEKAYAILDEIRTLLNEVYGEDHPFSGFASVEEV